ncbi:unnamed protein product [Leuciscus chuanchicus]
MAEARISVDQNEFLCPVCLDLLKDPVTTSCGHSYCKICITGCWDQEDQMRVYSCPQCRQTFSPRPALAKNTMLAELVEKLKKTKLPADCYAGAGDVQCDVCTGRKHKAVKSCLLCLESYCQTHFDRHEDFHSRKPHKVTDATGRLQEMICQTHDKLLEVFCRTDQKFICVLCTMDDHKNHDTVSAAAQRTEKQKQLKETQRSFQQRIQQREKDLQQLREAVESHEVTPPESTDVNDNLFSSLSSFDGVRESVRQLRDKLEDFCKEELKKISDRVTFSNIVPRTRNDFLQYSHQLTLDLNTVNNLLRLSERNRVITVTYPEESYPDHPDRFDGYMPQVLCRESVCGRCYWEIEWSGINGVCISVSYKSISRKGSGNECVFGYNDQSWSLICSSSSYSFRHNNIETELPVKPTSSRTGVCVDHSRRGVCVDHSRIGVCVDHSAGTLSFYSVSDTMSLIHTVQTTFTQPLYPGFSVYSYGSTVKLRFSFKRSPHLMKCSHELLTGMCTEGTRHTPHRLSFYRPPGGMGRDNPGGEGEDGGEGTILVEVGRMEGKGQSWWRWGGWRGNPAVVCLCVSCCKMAKARISVDQNEFLRPVCLDLLKDPVAISCGHSYCKICITGCWDQEDQMRVYSCPQCRQTFSPRPALAKNTMLAELVEKLKKTKLPADCYAGAGDVQCDVCTGRKHKAVKSCLVCLESYCQSHFDRHEDYHSCEPHKVTDATGRLQEMICQTHDKLLEVFCRTDQKFICVLCTMDDHKNHDTVSAAAQRTEKQTQAQKEEEEQIQAQYQDQIQAQEQIQSRRDETLDGRTSLTQRIRDQEKTAVSRAEERLERLEQEINDLRRRDAELEQLSHTQDHIHFLQSFQSLSAPPASTDVNDSLFSSLSSFDGVRESVRQLRDKLEDFCKEELKKISDRVTFSNIVPRTRNDFLQYSHQLTLDLNTVNNLLRLSERNRVITVTYPEIQSYPDHPDRFDHYAQVLCRESVCGRCYWEIEWSKRVCISVSYKSISRKGSVEQECVWITVEQECVWITVEQECVWITVEQECVWITVEQECVWITVEQECVWITVEQECVWITVEQECVWITVEQECVWITVEQECVLITVEQECVWITVEQECVWITVEQECVWITVEQECVWITVEQECVWITVEQECVWITVEQECVWITVEQECVWITVEQECVWITVEQECVWITVEQECVWITVEQECVWITGE